MYSVNLLYLIFIKVNVYIEEINKNRYLTLVSTNESKEKIKKYEELWIKIRDLIRSINKNSDDYDEKIMKIKLNSDMWRAIVVGAIFLENNNYYPQIVLDECLYKI